MKLRRSPELAPDVEAEIRRRGLPLRPAWRVALDCWRLPFTVSEDPGQVMKVFLALGGPSFARTMVSMLGDPDMRRLLAVRPDLRALLADDDHLSTFAPGTLGHAYRTFLRRHRLDAGVFDVDDVVVPVLRRMGIDDEDYLFMVDRGMTLHDMFHVLGGYGPDGGGEFANAGFHYGQMVGGSGMLRGFGLMFIYLVPLGVPTRRKRQYWSEAVERGRRAKPLMCAPVEDMLDLPIDEVRRRLDIEPDDVAHPHGHIYAPLPAPPGTKPAPYEPWIYPDAA